MTFVVCLLAQTPLNACTIDDACTMIAKPKEMYQKWTRHKITRHIFPPTFMLTGVYKEMLAFRWFELSYKIVLYREREKNTVASKIKIDIWFFFSRGFKVIILGDELDSFFEEISFFVHEIVSKHLPDIKLKLNPISLFPCLPPVFVINSKIFIFRIIITPTRVISIA